MTGTDEKALLARFEAERPRLRGLAFRMLGSLADAEDAVQDAWLRVSQADADAIDNFGGWLTTVVSRLCLDQLRRRRTREDFSDAAGAEAASPDEEVALADAVGQALLVVLDRLGPEERVAFVLHDLMDVPFADIAAVLGRSAVAVRQLASRARRRVVAGAAPAGAMGEHLALAQRYLDAARAGDLAGVIALLAPDAELSVDGIETVYGARAVAGRATGYRANAERSEIAVVGERVGLVLARGGRLVGALVLDITGASISRIELVTDRGRLEGMDVRVAAI